MYLLYLYLNMNYMKSYIPNSQLKNKSNNMLKSLKFPYNHKFFCSRNTNQSLDFKNKLLLKKENINLIKNLISYEVLIKNMEKTELAEKKFIFNYSTTIDDMIKTVEKEYNIKIDITSETIDYLKKEIQVKEYKNNKNSYLSDIQDILNKLNITEHDKEYKLFFDMLEEKDNKILDLKRQYMIISSEIDNMEKAKILIDKKVSFRLNIIFTLLLISFILITGLFYHGIYNLDDLGWDLVEPVTYLYSSVIFLLCLFLFIKLHKKSYSLSDIYDDLFSKLRNTRYMKYNFNYEKLNRLLIEKERKMAEIERLERI